MRRPMNDFGIWFSFQAIGHVSGGHLNPAVTVAMLVTGKISFVRALLYIIVQCAGAVAGTASLKSLLPEIYHMGLGHTTLAPELTPVSRNQWNTIIDGQHHKYSTIFTTRCKGLASNFSSASFWFSPCLVCATIIKQVNSNEGNR